MALRRELAAADKALNRLYDAVEAGVVDLDTTLQKRIQSAKARRGNALIEIASIETTRSMPSLSVLPSEVERFAALVSRRLRDRSIQFGREYLHALVDEIVVKDSTATMRGSYGRLAAVVGNGKKLGKSVPNLMCA
jgi:hypothetical protein